MLRLGSGWFSLRVYTFICGDMKLSGKHFSPDSHINYALWSIPDEFVSCVTSERRILKGLTRFPES